MQAYEYMVKELAELRLVANNKTTLYPPAVVHLTETAVAAIAALEAAKAITVDRRGVKIVGTMRSRDDGYVRQFLDAKMAKGANLFRRMAMLPPMQAFTILQKCGAPRATYLIRTHRPELTSAYTVNFDAQTRVVLEHVVRRPLEGASRETEVLAHLPPRQGGKGITRTAWIADAAYTASRDACDAAATDGPAKTTQETAVGVFNKGLAAEVDAMGPIEKAHRSACSERNSSLWTTALTEQFPPVEYSECMCFALAIPGDDVAPFSTCPGCHHIFDGRTYHEHKPGCALLKGANCSTTHHAVNKCLQYLAVRGGTGYQHEPRDDLYGELVPLGEDQHHEDYHLKGPDVRFHLPHSLVLDLKGVNMSCKSHAGKKPSSVERSKEAASRKLYGKACRDLGERFEVPCFHVCGRMNPAFIAVVRELVDQRPETLHFKDELMKCAVAIQRGVGRVMLAVAGSHKYADGKLVLPAAKASKSTAHGGTKAGQSAGDGV